jgi:(p)ppGpp synthase/HD superfamily hydrolase
MTLELARETAREAHGGQKYGDEPYEVHLDAVVEVLRRFGCEDSEILMAGYLHDTLEDTHLIKDLLINRFGLRVAELVDACTDGIGRNRKERKERPYRLIPQVPGALTVKLADRIANIESAAHTNPGLLKMYRKEQAVFVKRLYHHSHEEMFHHIDKLLGVDRKLWD